MRPFTGFVYGVSRSAVHLHKLKCSCGVVFSFRSVRFHGGSIRPSVLSVCPHVVFLHMMSIEYNLSSSLFRGRFGVRYACGVLSKVNMMFNVLYVLISTPPTPSSPSHIRSVTTLSLSPRLSAYVPSLSLPSLRLSRLSPPPVGSDPPSLPPVPTAGHNTPKSHLDTRHQPSSITFCKPAQPRY